MKAVVIDTNVLLVANGSHPEVSNECRIACISKLLDCRKTGIVVIDDSYSILREYEKKTFPNTPKGPGDAFLKWLLQNKNNRQRVHKVPLFGSTQIETSVLPELSMLEGFDPADLKFVQVALSHQRRPPIWQASDSKWLAWWQTLAGHGVVVTFLCPGEISRGFKKKFPLAALPSFPT